jgi:hypothetical protein
MSRQTTDSLEQAEKRTEAAEKVNPALCAGGSPANGRKFSFFVIGKRHYGGSSWSTGLVSWRGKFDVWNG